MNAVELNSVSKIIRKQTVLNNISLALKEKRIYGFVGRNGSGKTMLFRAICGLIRPTAGSIIVFGKKIGVEISFPPSVGLIIENVNFWPHYSGLQCLRLLASIKGNIHDQEIRESMERVGLDPDDKRSLKRYSLGMKQRLGIAQAIMEKPDLIVLDEPTNSLDSNGVLLVRNILLEEKARGATILLASHIAEDISLLSDEVIHIDQGQIQNVEVLP
ncbi:MAG: ABC transporter ATP-binding protein [Bacillota bacterium]|nr:ABC transporter ATP-binding protein [Bacillota bacterium]